MAGYDERLKTPRDAALDAAFWESNRRLIADNRCTPADRSVAEAQSRRAVPSPRPGRLIAKRVAAGKRPVEPEKSELFEIGENDSNRIGFDLMLAVVGIAVVSAAACCLLRPVTPFHNAPTTLSTRMTAPAISADKHARHSPKANAGQ